MKENVKFCLEHGKTTADSIKKHSMISYVYFLWNQPKFQTPQIYLFCVLETNRVIF